MKLVNSLMGRERKKDIVIVGASPSLIGFDWKLLRGKTTIAMNRAIYAPHEFTYWIHSEPFFIFRKMASVKKSKTIHVSPRDYDKPDYVFMGARWFDKRNHRKGELVGRPTVTIAAIDFAWLLGAKHVSFIGVDFVNRENSRYFDETTPPVISRRETIGNSAGIETIPVECGESPFWFPIYWKKYASCIRFALKSFVPYTHMFYSDKTIISGIKVVPLSEFGK